MRIFHGYVSHNQMVLMCEHSGCKRSAHTKCQSANQLSKERPPQKQPPPKKTTIYIYLVGGLTILNLLKNDGVRQWEG